jgi:protein-arginine kinase activator protein McsA
MNEKLFDMLEDRTKVCSKCKENLPISMFTKKVRGGDAVKSACKTCNRATTSKWEKANRERLTAKNKAWLAANPQRRTAYLARSRAKKFKLTEQQVQDLYLQHNHSCAICSEPETPTARLAIDHCHKSGKVRGLLCASCNHLLGKAYDSTDRLQKAILYLEAASKVTV